MRDRLGNFYDDEGELVMDRPAVWERFRPSADLLVRQARAILQDALPDSAAMAFWLKALALHEQARGGDVSLASVVAPFCRQRLRTTDLERLRSHYVTEDHWAPNPDGQDQGRILLAARILDAELKNPDRPFVLYTPTALLAGFDDAVAAGGGDAADAFLKLATTLAATGFRRALARLPEELAFAELAVEMSNFAEAINFYAGQAALARLGGSEVASFPPVLLLGPPGVGKTRCAERLAEILGSICRRIPMASTTAGWILTGLDRSWSTGKPGQVLLTLLTAPMANAMVLVDEIDKAHRDARCDPLGGFYPLLESETARMFSDECLGFPVDASALIWLATANDADAIPEPIRSRFTIFTVGTPSGTAARHIVYRVFERITHGRPFAPLNEAVVDLLVESPPRDLGSKLQAAAGMAAQRAVRNGDELAMILPADIVLPPARPSMRFI